MVGPTYRGAPQVLSEPAWLLAHCDSGVTWGYLKDSRWQLGSNAFPDLCPVPDPETIFEARIFSRSGEILLWRTLLGFSGRFLTDLPAMDVDDPARPDDESRLLLAGRLIERRNNFTRVGNGAGAEQVLPLQIVDRPNPWPRLVVRHYFVRDPETGVVSVAATRLVEVR
jgi:CRISPR-associated protein (TIGR03984 family)